MTSGIIEILIENTGVQDLVEKDSKNQWKVYPTQAPQGVNEPYVIVSEVSLNSTLGKGCAQTLDFPAYNVLAYSLDFRKAELIQAACRAALDTGTGFSTTAGATFGSIWMVDRKDLFAPAEGQAAGLFVKLGVYNASVQ